MWPIALIGAGTVLSAYGNYQANMQQSQMEAQNASYYRTEADAAKAAGARELTIFQHRADVTYGNEVGAFGAGNVDIGSGSAADVLAQSKVFDLNEKSAIEQQTNLRVNLAMLRAQQSQEHADYLSNGMNNTLELFGSMAGGAGRMASASNAYPQD